MGPLAHASQQGCPPKPLEQSDPEYTVLLLVPSRTTSTSESGARNIVAVSPRQFPWKLVRCVCLEGVAGGGGGGVRAALAYPIAK